MKPHLTAKRKATLKLHLTKAQLVAVGQVAIRSGTLDQMIESFTDHITRWDMRPSVRKAVLRFTIPEKVNFFGEWAEHYVRRDRKQAVKDFIGRVHAVRTERNSVIHHIWRPTESADTKDLVDQKFGLTKSQRRIATKDIADLADRIVALIWELVDWEEEASLARMRRHALLDQIPTANKGALSTLAKRREPERDLR